MLNNLLFYRMVIFNSLVACTVFWAYQMGIVQNIMHKDTTGTVYSIMVLLVLGILFSLLRGWKTSQYLNRIKTGLSANLLKVRKMPHKNEYLRDMAGWAVLIGLLGNAWGFSIVLGEGNVAGAGTAFGSTIVGIATALWLEVNFSMLRAATAGLLEDTLEYWSER